MPNIKSAEKRMRTSRKRAVRNRTARSQLRTAIKRVTLAEDADGAEEAYRRASALLDRAATRSLVHRNYAARKKSQLARIVQGLREQG